MKKKKKKRRRKKKKKKKMNNNNNVQLLKDLLMIFQIHLLNLCNQVEMLNNLVLVKGEYKSLLRNQFIIFIIHYT
jgi:ABC-type phosphate/phosphonate transport system ATPase subunit